MTRPSLAELVPLRVFEPSPFWEDLAVYHCRSDDLVPGARVESRLDDAVRNLRSLDLAAANAKGVTPTSEPLVRASGSPPSPEWEASVELCYSRRSGQLGNNPQAGGPLVNLLDDVHAWRTASPDSGPSSSADILVAEFCEQPSTVSQPAPPRRRRERGVGPTRPRSAGTPHSHSWRGARSSGRTKA